MQPIRRRAFLTGTTAAAGLALLSAPAEADPLLRFTLPRPTGPFPVGVRRRHLVNHDRPDPWHPSAPRELMISIWYPARDDPRHRRAPYLDPLVAEAYTRDGVLGIPANRVDWTSPTTTARVDARRSAGIR